MGNKKTNYHVNGKICHESNVTWTAMVSHRGEKAEWRNKTQGAEAIQWEKNEGEDVLVMKTTYAKANRKNAHVDVLV